MPVSELRRRAVVGADLDLKLLHSVWQDPPAGVILSGHTGDPLLYPRIMELLVELGGRGIDVVTITNGEAVTPEIAEAMVRVCLGIRISLDAYDAYSFSKVHGVGEASWHRVLAGIQLLLNARAAAGIAPDACKIGVGYLTDDNSRAGMLPATRLAKNMGADYIQFRPFHYRVSDLHAELAECLSLEDEGQFAVLASTQKYDLAHKPQRHYHACHGSMFYTALDPRGDIYLCCHHVTEPEARVGSLQQQSWQEFLKNEMRQQVAGTFPKTNCVPLCRLHPHNELLQYVLTNEEIPNHPPTGLAARHCGML